MSDQSNTEADLARAADLPRAIAAEAFYSGALRRINRFMLLLSPVLLIPAAWKFGLRPALGLAFGFAIAWVNFHWLKRVIAGFADRTTGMAASGSRQGVVFRFLLRYILMAFGAYAILTVSPASLHGLLAGLFLPVAAIFCEAAYEAYAALAHGL